MSTSLLASVDVEGRASDRAEWIVPAGMTGTAATDMMRIVFICISYWRSDRNAARNSAAKSSGCSHAAKWPPLSTSWK